MNEIDIIRAVTEEGYQISQRAAELIKSSDAPQRLLEYVLSIVDDSVFVIEAEHVDLEGFAASSSFKSAPLNGKEGPDSFSTEPNRSSELDRSSAEFDKSSEFHELSEPEEFSSKPDAVHPHVSDPMSDPHPDSHPDCNPGFYSDPYPGPVEEHASGLSPDSPDSPDLSPDLSPGSELVPAPLSDEGDVPGPISSSLSSGAAERPVSPLAGCGNSLFFPASGQASRADQFFFTPGRDSPFNSPVSSPVSRSGSSSDGVRHISGRNPVTVLSDITGHSTCVGEYMQFVQYFRDRYSRLSEIIRSRINSRPIESLKRRSFRRGGDGKQEEIAIIGMVSDISTTSNGHKILSLEDPTGSFSVLVRNSDKELFELASRVLLDEVIGVAGSVTNDGNLMLATKLIQPDVPNSVQRRTGSHGKAVLISDVHVGSSQFLEESWLDFLDFLKGESDSEAMREIAAEIRYLVVAGDLVDGVGIYPDQEMELDIQDVYEQYKKAGEYFREVPKHIRVIISPGNHDAVRQAEPQPSLPEKIRAYFPENFIFVGNPALVDLDGVSILIYHGRSIDDLVASIPGVSYQEPAGAVLEMVKRRHLAPMYGSRVSISPEKKDYFVIDQVPDIIHTGHVHTLGVQRYKNVLLVNSGTWQGQTEFQKRVNLMPMPARVPVVDLSDFDVKILTFD